MLAEKNPYIGSAYQQLQLISQDKEKRLEYEAREKAIRDHNQLLFEAEQRGEQKGKQHGIQLGIEQGKHEEAIRIARDLLLLNIPDATIINITNITEEQLKTLKNAHTT